MRFTKLGNTAFTWMIIVNLLLFSNFADGAEDKLSETQYVDPKGYFKLVPPAGWHQQEFKNDPRGKVKFLRSSPSGTMLQVIAQTSSFRNLEELIEDAERAATRFKQKYSASSTIEKTSFAGVPAIRFKLEIANKLIQMQIQFILGGNYYTIAYGASPDSYELFLPIALASFGTFEPVLKKTSKEESIKHIIASKVRTATNLIQLGQNEYALILINEGLSLDQDNENLLKLKKSISSK